MKNQALNPYLPSYEYTPDGEPHVFRDITGKERLYVYGSHDKFNGTNFCMNDYVCWSAPVEDLSDWKYEGVIYRKDQAADNEKNRAMQAPDVAQGSDGRFYLYYTLMYHVETQVAVSDNPAGPFEYYGMVHWPSGKPYGKRFKDYTSFDPAVLVDDDGKIYFYMGNSMGDETLRKIGRFMHNVKMMATGGHVLELEPDMLTVKSKKIGNTVPGLDNSKGTSFEGHEFFEASSIRKFDGKYYFVYSTMDSHDLCYAVSDKPDRDFVYGGRLHSNANIGYQGIVQPTFYYGNNHGSLVKVRDKYYIFGHRQTNATEFSRQAVAEEIIYENGAFLQAEMTSCGLNGGPLVDEGTYNAGIACVLIGPEGCCKVSDISDKALVPYITQSGEDREENPDQYIANISKGTVIGYKYFEFKNATKISVITRGGAGVLSVYHDMDGKLLGQVNITAGDDWHESIAKICFKSGKQALYFKYEGNAMDMKEFQLFCENVK